MYLGEFLQFLDLKNRAFLGGFPYNHHHVRVDQPINKSRARERITAELPNCKPAISK